MLDVRTLAIRLLVQDRRYGFINDRPVKQLKKKVELQETQNFSVAYSWCYKHLLAALATKVITEALKYHTLVLF